MGNLLYVGHYVEYFLYLFSFVFITHLRNRAYGYPLSSGDEEIELLGVYHLAPGGTASR